MRNYKFLMREIYFLLNIAEQLTGFWGYYNYNTNVLTSQLAK